MAKFIGPYLKKLLEEKRMTQKKLSELSGLSTTTISRLITGERGHRPSYEVIDKLAKGLGVPIAELSKKFGIPSPLENEDEIAQQLAPEKDITAILNQTKTLLHQENLLFDGKPASADCIQSILDAMSIGMEMARKRNKEKFTPKKYL